MTQQMQTDDRIKTEEKIREYRLHWDGHRQTGEVELMLEAGHTVKVKVESLPELAGLGMILEQCPVYITADNRIYTGRQQVKG